MKKDIRSTTGYTEAEALFEALRQPGTGQVSDAAELHASPDGKHAVFSGTLTDALDGTLPTRICQVDLTTGSTRVLTYGPNVERCPKYSPDGRHIAFLSDRKEAGNFQLYLLDAADGTARSMPHVDGWIEYLHWSPSGRKILLGVAGHGADISGGQGAVTSRQTADRTPSWMPTVETGDESFRWRRAWIYELDTNDVRQISPPDTNIWETVWCGDAEIAAIASSGPGEGLWYSARLHIIDVATGSRREVYQPRDQLGWPAASPSGRCLALVEAVCSDRWIVAGDLLLIDTASGQARNVDTLGVDVTHVEWRSERHLLLAGHREFETVVGLLDVVAGAFVELWSSSEMSGAGRYISVSGLNDGGDCVLVAEGFLRAPEIGMILQRKYRPVRSFDLGYADAVDTIESVERVRWNAPDGLEIQGWLLRPKDHAPHPLVMYVHGGPVWHWHPAWLGRGHVAVLLLLRKGYAVFFPNPRGSTGRGRTFARQVLGDMGGADTFDYLSGLDDLVGRGIADPKRLGVTGGSYGGFMTSWLITQDPRFAAAVPVAPVTNHVSAHLITNIPEFVALFLADSFTNAHGKYHQRSPIMHARKARTPTLNICGALDRCTPPEEAVQFHNALLENKVRSVLITYPQEGHGVRKLPAAVDYAARVVAWFEAHMPGNVDGPDPSANHDR